MSDRARFEHAVRVTHGGRRCERCTQFYTDEHGEVHPIRGSPGYSEDVAEHGRQERHRRGREAHYATARQERHSDVVERPPWAAGLSERHLLTIAKAHGQSAGSPLWWEKAGLHSGSGELHRALSEGGRRERRARAQAERPVQQSRAEMRRIAAQSAAAGADLPW